MITGYNTDIRHRETVFHVQTEDKGAANPCVESLVYVKGQVIANKRTNYADLIAEGKGEKAIIALIEHQHRVMIAAIKSGKLDDKVAALAGGKKPGQPALIQTPSPLPALADPPALAPAEKPASAAKAAAVAEAPALPRENPLADDKTLDQVILEYLSAEANQEQLALVMNGQSGLALGKRGSLELKTTSSKSGLPIAGAQVTVRMISTVAYPRTLAQGETDGTGSLRCQLDIPLVEQGIAALIITAASTIGNAELKHIL
jgi:hypothetical protein